MCGIAFMYSNFISDQEVRTFNELLVLSSLRGTDSTGSLCTYVSVDNSASSAKVAKTVGSVYNLLEDDIYKRTLQKPEKFNRRLLLGHCRAATKGHKSVSNAHPFIVGDIFGVHNGTITAGLPIPEGETDSQALFETIEREGIEGLKDVSGAYALVWWNDSEKSLNVLRNDTRTLYFGKSAGNILAASEKTFLECVGERNTKITEIKLFEPFVHYKFTIDKYSVAIEEIDYTKVLKKNFTVYNYGGKFRSGFLDDYEGYSGYGAYDKYVGTGTTKDDKKREKDSKEAAETLFTHFLPGVNKTVTEGKFNELMVKGCCYCGEVKDEDDWAYFSNKNDETIFICSDCTEREIKEDRLFLEGTFPGICSEYETYQGNNGPFIN